jgi:four helix bundle protein
MQDCKKLSLWEKAYRLVLEIYRSTSSFPRDELYGLTSQIRRASVSIPVNIAEGCGKEGNIEFGSFFKILVGSASELEYYLLLAFDLKYLNQEAFEHIDDQTNQVKEP